MIRALSVAAVMAIAAGPAAAETLHFEPDHTSATFYYEHFGLSHPSGKVMGAKGTLVLDDDPTKDRVDATLDMTTLATAIPVFDDKLKSSSYFDAAKFPTASFRSTSVVLTGDTTDPKTADVTGDLTVHGVTKSVVLHVTFNRKAFNPALFKSGYGFTATAHLSRSDFGLGNLEPIVGDVIDLVIEAEAF